MNDLSNHNASSLWPKVSVRNVLKLVNGRAFKPSEWSKAGVPIVRIQNLNNAEAMFNYYNGDLPQKFSLTDGDLLFAWSGTPGTSFGAHIWRGGKAWLNQHIFLVHFDAEQFDKRFLQLAINQNLAEYIRAAHGGAGLAHITKGKFEDSQLPQPSLDEQRQIVAEIDKQFTRLEAGAAALKRVQANLKRLRAAILKAACEGRLVPTEADLARSESRTYETGDQLLACILAERRRKWQGRGKYKEPTAPDAAQLQHLPEGWAWATAEQLTDENHSITYGVIKLGDVVPNGVPILRSSNVRHLKLDLKEVKRISPNIADNFTRTFLSGNEILITVRGTLGGVVVTPTDCNGFNISREVAMLKMVNPTIAKAISIFIGSTPIQGWLMRRTKGIAYTGINIETLKQLPIPLPPLAEQERIVAEVERRLSVVEEQEAVVSASLQRAARLRQSILQRAFTGGLVYNGT